MEDTITTDFESTNESIVATAYNAILAMESINAMTEDITTRKHEVIQKSFDLIEACINELHDTIIQK